MSRMELGIKRPLLAVAAVLAVLLAGWFLSGSMAEPDDVAVADTARAGSGKGGIPKGLAIPIPMILAFRRCS